MAEFVRARHPDVQVEALLPTTAFRVMTGWEPVEDVKVPSPSDGTVDRVLARVGTDPARARAALDAEQSSSHPRSTLVARLSEIVNQNREQ